MDRTILHAKASDCVRRTTMKEQHGIPARLAGDQGVGVRLPVFFIDRLHHCYQAAAHVCSYVMQAFIAIKHMPDGIRLDFDMRAPE